MTITEIQKSGRNISGGLWRIETHKISFPNMTLPDIKNKVEIIFRITEGKLWRN